MGRNSRLTDFDIVSYGGKLVSVNPLDLHDVIGGQENCLLFAVFDNAHRKDGSDSGKTHQLVRRGLVEIHGKWQVAAHQSRVAALVMASQGLTGLFFVSRFEPFFALQATQGPDELVFVDSAVRLAVGTVAVLAAMNVGFHNCEAAVRQQTGLDFLPSLGVPAAKE